MKKSTRDGRVTGVGLIFVSVLLLAIGYNTLSPVLGIIIGFFGISGALCVWKPDSIGPIISELLDRWAKNATEQPTGSSKQVQEKTHHSVQSKGDNNKIYIIEKDKDSDD